MLDQLGIDQTGLEGIDQPGRDGRVRQQSSYPVLVRPSYVLSGAAMNVCYNEDDC